MTNRVVFETPVEVGFTFEKNIKLTVEEISIFAGLCGDLNPMHHDEEIAKASRFNGIIASGPQSSSLFMASMATYLAPGFLVMGMSFDVQFVAPVRPETELRIHWVVKTVVPKTRLGGYIVTTEGGIRDSEKDLLLGNGTSLVIKA